MFAKFQAIFTEIQGALLSVTYAGNVITTPFSFLDCTLPIVEFVSPSKAVSSGGTSVVIYIRNLKPYSSSLPMQVVFGESESIASVASIEGITGQSVTLARLEFVVPSVPFEWEVMGALMQDNGLNIPFSFLFEKTCNYEKFCVESSTLSNIPMLNLEPPSAPACDDKYCLALGDIPVPFLVSIEPSMARTTGGTAITLIMTGFPAMNNKDLIEIYVGTGSNRFPAFIESLTVNVAGGAGGIDSKVTLKFLAPLAPSSTGLSQSEVLVNYGSKKARLEFKLFYVRPLSGPIKIDFYSPKSIFSAGDHLFSVITVEISNAPVIRLSDPAAQNKLRIEIKDFSGSSKFSSVASSITLSDNMLTNAVYKVDFPLPITMLEGDYKFYITHTSNSADRAGIFDFKANALGNPNVIALLPAKAVLASTSPTLMSLNVQYFTRVPVRPRVEYANEGGTWSAIEIVSQSNTAGCTKRSCNTATMNIRLNNPTGSAGMTSMRVCDTTIDSDCATIPFELTAADQTEVYLVSPREGIAAGTPQRVSLHVRNFPANMLGGSKVTQEQVRIKIAGVSYAVLKWIKQTVKNIYDVFEFNIPIEGQALPLDGRTFRDLDGVVYVEGDVRGEVKHGLFTYRILRATGTATPIDSSSNGGERVTLRLYWGFSINSQVNSLTVFFGGVRAVVAEIFNVDGDDTGVGLSVSHTDVDVITPVMEQTGIIHLTVSGSYVSSTGNEPVSETIAFEVYGNPFISAILPNKASLDGSTGECSQCLVHKPNSVSLWVDNFPTSFVSDLRVEIGLVECSVISLQNLANSMYLAVTVPASSTLGDVDVTVTFVGKGPAPTGMGRTDDYTRTKRVASGAFAYFRPQPKIKSVFYCASCVFNEAVPCVCADEIASVLGPETDTVLVPATGGGVLTLELAHAGVIPRSPKPLVKIGTTSAQIIVRSSTSSFSVLELQIPAFTSVGKRQGIINIQPNVFLSFSMLVYDSKIQLLCVSSTAPYNSVPCVSAGATTITVQVTGLNVGRPQDVYKSLSARFGTVLAAKTIIWKCCEDGSKLILSVAIPAHTAFPAFFKGRHDLNFKIELVNDSMQFAVTTLTIWAPPFISKAQFESDGTSLMLNFDQPTNTNTLSKGAGSCSSIVTSERSLGDGASCMWHANDVLQVNLGFLADISVDDMIGVSSNSNVRSRNGISLPMDAASSSVTVVKPSALLVPGPSKMIAPSSVDPCGTVELSFVVPSPRRLDYFWSCLNNIKLDNLLRTHNSQRIVMDRGTPELEIKDMGYEIQVYATDFLGVDTATEEFTLYKSGSASPALSIVGQAEYLTTQDLVVKGSASFSQCFGAPKGNLLYSWDVTESGTGVIGSAPVLDVNQRSKPELFFAPMSLAPMSLAIAVHKAVLTVTNEDDASQFSAASFDLVIVQPALVAIISGGARISFSQHATMTLNALASHDPQMGSSTVDTALRFSWICYMGGNPEKKCLNQRQDDKVQATDLEKALDLSRTGSISLDPFTLAVTNEYTVYTFEVTVSKGDRSSSFSTHVTVLAADVPTALISSSSFSVFQNHLPKINANSRLNLEMMPSLQSEDLSYRWTVRSEVGESFLTESDAVPMNYNQKKFVLLPPPDVFLPSFTYSITLTVTSVQSQQSGSNVLSLIINKPPSSGKCEACNLDAASAGTSCTTSGVALQDTFRVSCQLWADDDLPLSYIFGFEVSGGDVTTFSPMGTPFKRQLLPAGAVALTAQVVDSIDAVSPVQRLAVSVRTGRRLLSLETTIDNALSEARTARDTGDASQVNMLAQIIAVSLDSNSNTYSASQRHSIRGELEQLVNDALDSAAPTVDSAVEALGAGAKVGSVPCELSADAFKSLLDTIQRTCAVSTARTPFPAVFGDSLAMALRLVSWFFNF